MGRIVPAHAVLRLVKPVLTQDKASVLGAGAHRSLDGRFEKDEQCICDGVS